MVPSLRPWSLPG